ncbi:enoyl-CoA hydratase-related protein [Streptomyces sp. NPDC004752]
MSIATERVRKTLVIRLDRPAKRNAIDRDMSLALDAALNTLEDDPGLRAGVIAGHDSVFSAGSDLRNAPGDTWTDRGGEYGLIRRRRAKPLIAAVEGLAYGGGFEIALACDMIVASTTATFAFPEVLRGVLAASGGLFRAPRALPLHVAKEMLLTGRPLTAERAHTLGLVNRLSEPGQALAQALLIADDVAAASPVSVEATMRAVADVVEREDEQAWQATAEAFAVVRQGPDEREGISAFFEKRSPKWMGDQVSDR